MARSLRKTVELVEKGVVWSIGDGKNINFWSDSWLVINGEPTTLKKLLGLDTGNNGEMIADYLKENGAWDEGKLQCVPEPVRRDITKVVVRKNVKDKLIWRHTKQGAFSVKSAYRAATSVGDAPNTSTSVPTAIYNRLWNAALPPHIKIFIWKCLADALPTGDKLRRNHMLVDAECTFCNSNEETMEHLLFTCCEWI
ncbi:hypothetical protein ACHQM5_015943 [Ranunculus cassubicifolius]